RSSDLRRSSNPLSQKKPRRSGAWLRLERLLVGRSGLAGRRAARAASARARPGGRASGRRRASGRGRLAAAEELGFHAPIGLQAGDQLLVLVALGAELRALVARDRLALALALDLQAAGIAAFLGEVVGDGLGARLGELLVVL